MPKEIIDVPVLSQSIRQLKVPLSLVTKAGGSVFVSGLPPLDLATGSIVRGTIEQQTEASLRALVHCLEAAGATLADVAMVRIYCANAAYYAAINAVYARFFAVDPPARTFVPVASWPMEFDIEIDCVATP